MLYIANTRTKENTLYSFEQSFDDQEGQRCQALPIDFMTENSAINAKSSPIERCTIHFPEDDRRGGGEVILLAPAMVSGSHMKRAGPVRRCYLGLMVLKLGYSLLVLELHAFPLVQQLLVASPVHLYLHGEFVRHLSSLNGIYSLRVTDLVNT